MAQRRVGSVERATRARLGKLRGVDVAVKACAVALARRMDDEPSAAVARELRLTVQSLVAEAWEAAPRRDPAGPASTVEEDEADELAEVIGRIGQAKA